jgi:fatty acid synthase
MFLSGLATLYELGYNLSIENLYPRVEWPVARNTPSINSLIKWDHSTELSVRKYPEWFDRSNASDMNYTVNCKDKGDRAYLDHAVDGNPIFPATGYLMLAWRKLAASVGKLWYKVPVVFENVQLKRATFLSDEKNTKLKVKYYPLTGI